MARGVGAPLFHDLFALQENFNEGALQSAISLLLKLVSLEGRAFSSRRLFIGGIISFS